MRQPLPASSPRPPPTSMSKRVRSSAAQLGVVDAVGQPDRCELRQPPLLGEEAEAELGQRVLEQAADVRCRACDASSPSSSNTPRPACERVEHRDRRGVVVAARGADVVGEQREVEVPRLRRAARGCGRGRPPAARSSPGERPGGTPRHFCVPEYTASIPQRSTSTGMPPSDVTVSTSKQRVGLLERGQRRDVVLDSGRRLRVHDREHARVRRCARCASSSCCGSMARPHGARRARPRRRSGARPRTCVRRTRR